MKETDFTGLAFEIRWFALFSVKLASRDIEARLAALRPGLSSPQFIVLTLLACRPLTLKGLADCMMLTPSSLVPIIDRLESEGLVVRGQDPDDRRRRPLTLTEDARRLLARAPEIDPNDRDCRALQTMGAAKGRQLSRLLREFISEMAGDDRVVEHILSRSPCRNMNGNARAAGHKLQASSANRRARQGAESARKAAQNAKEQ